MTTTDAEAIALDTALRMFNAELERWLDSSDARLKDFTPLAQWQRVVSLLASRREAQEPIHQYRVRHCADGKDYETRVVYTAPPPPAPAGEVERLREALGVAEQSFERIRMRLISQLDEPARSAFWKAVEGRNKARAALNGVAAMTDDLVARLRLEADRCIREAPQLVIEARAVANRLEAAEARVRELEVESAALNERAAQYERLYRDAKAETITWRWLITDAGRAALEGSEK